MEYEHISQLEETRIREDMARAEAERREEAIREANLQQERIKAPVEVCYLVCFCDTIALISYFPLFATCRLD